MTPSRTTLDFPEPARPGASRTALSALQGQALFDLGSPDGDRIAVRLYASAAAHGREHLETASDPAAYRAAVRAGALPGPDQLARFAARKRWMAEAATVAIAEGARQIAFLGAGFDTRGLALLDADPGLLVVELDRPAMIAAKEAALAAASIRRPWPRCVAIDLGDTRPLAGALAAAGWHASEPSLFVAEFALEYLEPDAAIAVLTALGTLAAPGSRIACTVRFGDIDDDPLPAATAAVGEPMRFRPLSAEFPALLDRVGLHVLAPRGRVLIRTRASAFLLLAPASTAAGMGDAA